MDRLTDPIVHFRSVSSEDSKLPADIAQAVFRPISTVILEALIDGSGL